MAIALDETTTRNAPAEGPCPHCGAINPHRFSVCYVCSTPLQWTIWAHEPGEADRGSYAEPRLAFSGEAVTAATAEENFGLLQSHIANSLRSIAADFDRRAVTRLQTQANCYRVLHQAHANAFYLGRLRAGNDAPYGDYDRAGGKAGADLAEVEFGRFLNSPRERGRLVEVFIDAMHASWTDGAMKGPLGLAPRSGPTDHYELPPTPAIAPVAPPQIALLFESLQAQISRRVAQLLAECLGGSLDDDDAARLAYGELLGGHALAGYFGRVRAGSTEPFCEFDRTAFGEAAAQAELIAFERTLNSARAGRREAPQATANPTAQLAARFGKRLRGTANQGWVGYLDRTEEIEWLTSTEPGCETCRATAAAGPYSPETLPFYPGEAVAPCGDECRCSLRTQGGATGF